MRLRTLEAASSAEAMHRMRKELGDRAVIVDLATGPSGVAVTAGVEDAAVDLAELLAPPAAGGRETIEAALAAHRLHDATHAALTAALRARPAGQAPECLAAALEATMRFAALAPAVDRPLALVGSAGVGKTAMVAKLAVAAKLAGRPVEVVSLDAERAGGIVPLNALLAPLALEARTQLPQEPPKPGAWRLIDTPALEPGRASELARLQSLVQRAGAEAVLVVPAGQDAADAYELAECLKAIGVRRAVATRLDAARRLGSILAVGTAGVALAEASLGAALGKGLAALNPLGLARVLLRTACNP